MKLAAMATEVNTSEHANSLRVLDPPSNDFSQLAGLTVLQMIFICCG
jgi:hypothetical protein